MSVYYYVREYLGKIMILIGVVLLVLGVLSLNLFGSIYSAGSLFFGIILLFFGFFAQLGFFWGNLRSLGGVGTILICVSVASFALSIAVAQFLEVRSIAYGPVISHGTVLGWAGFLITDRPFTWMSDVLMQLGLTLLVIGIVLKIVHALGS
jgi:hypothetical protein